MRKFDVAVIGLGAFGSSTLYNLSQRGIKAIGLEQFEPGHAHGSSHGESRIIRLSYYENPGYVPLLREAYKLWDELDAGAASKILTRTGILEAGFPASPLIKSSLKAAAEHHLTPKRLTGDEIAKIFPAFNVPREWIGLFEEHGGFLRPEIAIRRFIAYAERNGAVISTGTKIEGFESQAEAVLVRTAFETIAARSVVVTAGAWNQSLTDELGMPLTITRQTIAWYDPISSEDYALGRCPVFILDAGKERSGSTSSNVCYGFPDFNSTGVKVASHAEGPVVQGHEALLEQPELVEDPRFGQCWRIICRARMAAALK